MPRVDQNQRYDRVLRSRPREVAELLESNLRAGRGCLVTDARARWGLPEKNEPSRRGCRAHNPEPLLRRPRNVDAKFPLGDLAITPGCRDALKEVGLSPLGLLTRHMTGDWGDLDADDKAANEEAIAMGTRIFSAYELETGAKVWIITEADRSSTTLLLAEEY